MLLGSLPAVGRSTRARGFPPRQIERIKATEIRSLGALSTQSSAFLIADCACRPVHVSPYFSIGLCLEHKLRAPIHPKRRRLNLHKCFGGVKAGCIANGDWEFRVQVSLSRNAVITR